LAKFLRHVDRTGDCWLWTGPTTPNGYGTFRLPGKKPQVTHVIAYTHWKGPVPAGKQLDHRCHTDNVDTCTPPCQHRLCCNPDHLEPVTPAENTFRSDHAERKVTHCPKGHRYTEDNTIRRGGKRFCRSCDQERKRTPSTSAP
jgi:hypothetical protein